MEEDAVLGVAGDVVPAADGIARDEVEVDAVALVGELGGADGVGADSVGDNEICGGPGAIEVYAVAVVARDDVAGGAADGVAVCAFR